LYFLVSFNKSSLELLSEASAVVVIYTFLFYISIKNAS